MRLSSTNVLAAALLCGACATVKETPQVRMDSQPVDLSQLTPAEVARAVQITTKDGSTIYRAPTLSVSKEVDLRRGGPGLSVNLGTTTMGRMGFLFGVRDGRTAVVKNYAAFHSDFIAGTNRFAAVKLADGTALPIRTTNTPHHKNDPTSYLVFETVVAEVPEAALRSATTNGLMLTVVLDNGTTFAVTAPAAYVQGYLLAVDQPR